MRISIGKKKISTFSIILCLMIILSIFAHIMKTVTGHAAMIAVINYLSWIIFGVYTASYCVANNFRLEINKTILGLWFILFISSVISMINGERLLNISSGNYKAMICILASILLVACIKWEKQIDERCVCLICKTITLLAFAACLYAMVFQGQNIINVITNNNSYISSWTYYSFFGQRNIFAGFCFLGTICSAYLWRINNKKYYAVLCILLIFQICITSSRTSLLAIGVFCFILYLLLLKQKSKIIIALFTIILIVLCLYNFGAFDSYTPTIHYTSEGVDSSSLRIMMWLSGLQKQVGSNTVIFGFGEGSIETFLFPIYGYSSFHNCYMDILFQGGIMRLLIYLILSGVFLYNILHSANDAFKAVFTAGFFAYNVYCLTESGAMMFELNYFSIITTVMFGILPVAFKKSKNGYRG